MASRAEDLGYVSRADYLAAERVAQVKSEWVGGAIFSMAGASKRHVDVVAGLIELLRPFARRSDCFIGSSDLMVETNEANYYPDVVATCEPSDDPYVEHNPCFIAEVLSPSTQRTDRIEKREAYCSIASMRTYWVVNIDAKNVEQWQRADDGSWNAKHYWGHDQLHVPCFGATVDVVSILGV